MTGSGPHIAVCGAGQWGINHVRNFQALGALAAVVDPSPAARAKVAEIAPGVAVYENPDAILADPKIRGVVLATPAKNHADDTLRAIAAGKDVLVEKPMALTVAEAEAMATAAERADKILMVGHLLLYQPAIDWIRSQIRAGALGDIWHIETRRLNLGKVRSVENVFWSFAPHDLAVIHSLLGEPALTSAAARGQCNVQATVHDQVHADFTFADGATGHVHTAWFWPTKLRVTTVIGSKSMIVYDEVAQTVTHYDSTIEPQSLQTKGGKGEVVPVADGEPLRRECQHFLDCIATRRQPLSHGRHGVEVVRMLAAADKALQV